MLSRLICFSVTLLSLSIAANTQTSTQANIIQPPDLNADYSYNYKQIKNVEPDVKTLTTELFGDNGAIVDDEICTFDENGEAK